MLAAIFGLVGVIVGGLITGGVEMMLETRRETKTVATAKRLVLDELHNIWSQMDLLAQRGTSPTPLAPEQMADFLATGDWAKYRETLADPHALTDDEWVALSNFMQTASSLRTIVLALPPGTPLPPPLRIGELRDAAAEIFRHHARTSPASLGS